MQRIAVSQLFEEYPCATRVLPCSPVSCSRRSVRHLSSPRERSPDYQRAMGMREKYQGLAVNVPEPATWIEKTSRFWYRRIGQGRQRVRRRRRRDPAETAGVRSREAGGCPHRGAQAGEDIHRRHAALQHVQFRRRRARHRDHRDQRRVAVHARGLHVPDRPAGRSRRTRWAWRARRRRTRRPGACRIRHQRLRAAEVSRRQARSPRQQLQPRHPRNRQNRGDAAERRWLRRRLLRSQFASSGRRIQRRSRSTRSSRAIAATSTTSSPHPKISCSRNTRRCSTPSRATSSTPRSPCSSSSTARSRSSSTMRSFPMRTTTTALAWRKDSSAVTFEYNQRGHQVYRVIEVEA